MDIFTLLGMILAFACCVYGVISGGGQLGWVVDIPSMVVTVGGTTCVMLVGFKLSDLSQLGKLYGKAMKNSHYDVVAGIKTIIDLANVARKEGLLALEEIVKSVDEPFLQKGVLLIVDGTDAELVKGIMEAEIGSLEGRHSSNIGILETMASFAPAFGMIGTLIGLVNMLKSLDDPSALGPGMAVALITTLYGSLIANIVCNPVASKLKAHSAEEIMFKEIMLEGMLSIQAGENPRIIEEKLFSFLPRKIKEQSLAAAATSNIAERE
ncbi:MAG: MotA/TolQ/ExbB proton channel family protein [Oscillospiraceae bacterium]|nr:MotA/TolQ/ExbB proton channel family protein [Oscillospiraceae bacterium]